MKDQNQNQNQNQNIAQSGGHPRFYSVATHVKCIVSCSSFFDGRCKFFALQASGFGEDRVRKYVCILPRMMGEPEVETSPVVHRHACTHAGLTHAYAAASLMLVISTLAHHFDRLTIATHIPWVNDSIDDGDTDYSSA